MCVDSSAHSRAAKPEFMQVFGIRTDIGCGFPNRKPIGSEFLAEPNWHRVLHVGAAGLHHFPEFFALLVEAPSDRVEHWIEFLQFDECGQAHRGREDVVRRLPIVDVVVGMNSFVLAQPAAEDLFGAIGDYLVRIHVEADAGARLKDINHKLAVPFAVDHLLCGSNDGVGNLRVYQPKLLVGFRRCSLDHGNSADQRRVRPHSRNRIILHRARSLYAVIDMRRNLFWANGVFLKTSANGRGRGHDCSSNRKRTESCKKHSGTLDYKRCPIRCCMLSPQQNQPSEALRENSYPRSNRNAACLLPLRSSSSAAKIQFQS